MVVTSTATASATVTGTQHVMSAFNSQIRVGQKIQGTTATVSAVQEHLTSGIRKTQFTTSTSITINNGATVTFESTDNKFTNTGRVGQSSVFYITVERLEGRVLSPVPAISLSGVYSMADYKVSFSDTMSATLLVKRVYTITHVVPLKKQTNLDEIHVKGLTVVSRESSLANIYGYELLVKPSGQSIESITNSKASSFKNLNSFSFPSNRFINKKSEKRLLVVYGAPGATFKLGVLSNVIPITSSSSAQTSQTTLSMGNGTDAVVSKINKDMTITAAASSGISEGIKVVSTSGTNVVVFTAQSLAANEEISFGHVLIAANTVKTIDSNGIYYAYLRFPENFSSTNITFSITITENVADTFVEFDSPSIVSVVSLSTREAVNDVLITRDTRITRTEQVASTSNAATGAGAVVANVVQGFSNNSGGA